MLVKRSNLEPKQKVYYVTLTGEKVPAVITKVNDVSKPSDYSEQYVITVTSNKCITYRKGERFTTSGNWLRLR